MRELTANEQRFVEEMLLDPSPVECFFRAGYKATDRHKAGVKVQEIMKRPKVKAALAEGRKKRADRLSISQDMVIKRLWAIASADPNELVSVHREPCRHCWGIEHKYQFTDMELEERNKEAEQLGLDKPDQKGGGGFQPSDPPHPKCPQCGGRGKSHVVLKDTRDLSPAARLLYAGAEMTRNGAKINMNSQMTALIKLAEHYGLFESEILEEMRKAQLKKVKAETDQIGKELTPVKVVINTIDASNPERDRGDDDSKSDTERTAD